MTLEKTWSRARKVMISREKHHTKSGVGTTMISAKKCAIISERAMILEVGAYDLHSSL